LLSQSSVFFVAKDNDKIVGFIYFNTEDMEKCFNKQACLVYLAVSEEYRKQGIATELYNSSIKEIKNIGIKYVFVWADLHSKIIFFLEKMGYSLGKEHVLMDKLV